jgi:hypothetical protein
MIKNIDKIFSLGIFVFFLTVFPVFGRDIEIYVEDTDLEMPLEGAAIRSWDGKTYQADENGKVTLTVPDDRTVVIQAAYPGYENGRLIISLNTNRFTLKLSLSGVMENRELVIEAERPGTSETKTGRSVAVTEKEITQTAEIGIIEDVMTTIKLLPGVGYVGLFNAQPSIRGGEPGDMMASLDGFYIQHPYYWGGGFSIFDPKMVQSAQLSHGVFSARYGHSISGLLDVTSRKASPTETEAELGISTSSANLNLSFPLFGKGGVAVMGRVTYYDPVIWLAKQIAKGWKDLAVVNAINVAPYIRSAALSANYRLTGNVELGLSGFWGMDGVGALYQNDISLGDYMAGGGYFTDTYFKFDWTNYQGFGITSLTWNPRNNMLLKATAGMGYMTANMDADIRYDLNVPFTETFKTKYFYLFSPPVSLEDHYQFYSRQEMREKDTILDAQARLDYDWDLGKGFLIASGVQEMYNQWISEIYANTRYTERDSSYAALMSLPELYVNYPFTYNVDSHNHGFFSSAYALLEYTSPNKRIGGELGVRGDHLFFKGENFSIQSMPVVNPRINIDIEIFKNLGFIESMTGTLGTGLFSSMVDVIAILEERYGIKDFELRPNRSWTSIAGTKFEFGGGLSLNVEGYYKYVFDRAYVTASTNSASPTADVNIYFNGTGSVWGIDVMLQQLTSRYFDGWISYSFNHSRYKEPDGINSGMIFINQAGTMGTDWYYPSYHRFHNLNVVLNFRPLRQINFTVRLGLASGALKPRRIGEKDSYPVYIIYRDDPSKNTFNEQWRWPSVYDENSRTTISLPLDIKFSIFQFNKSGKAQGEIYFAVENALALIYRSEGNSSFNSYTGEDDNSGMSASYEIPIPIPSFGFKWSY